MVTGGKIDISMILDIGGHSNKDDVVGDDRTSILVVLIVVSY